MSSKIKKIASLSLAVIMLVATLASCNNSTIKEDVKRNGQEGYVGSGIVNNYDIDVFKDHVLIHKYVGKEEVIVVPKQLEGKDVTGIKDQAFDNEDGRNIKEVLLPNTIMTMTQYAFYKVPTLEKISFDGRNKNFKYEDGIVYNRTGTNIVTYPAQRPDKEFVIPNTVTVINPSQFSNCVHLEKITIPESVTRIENFAFKNCSSLKTATLPNKLATIGTGIFIGCTSLEELILPKYGIDNINAASVAGAPLKKVKAYTNTAGEFLVDELKENGNKEVKFIAIKE